MPARGEEAAACKVCGGRSSIRYALCYCCTTTVRQLQMPLAPVVAMTSYRVGDGRHRLLRGYKDASVADARRACLRQLSSLVESWLSANADRVRERFGCSWSVVTTVPSSRRPAGSPADALVARVPELARLHRPLLVRGSEAVDHLIAARHGFEVAPEVGAGKLAGERILVFDDSITTGSRAQSAVAALRRGGAPVAGVLAVGRALAPDRS